MSSEQQFCLPSNLSNTSEGVEHLTEISETAKSSIHRTSQHALYEDLAYTGSVFDDQRTGTQSNIYPHAPSSGHNGGANHAAESLLVPQSCVWSTRNGEIGEQDFYPSIPLERSTSCNAWTSRVSSNEGFTGSGTLSFDERELHCSYSQPRSWQPTLSRSSKFPYGHQQMQQPANLNPGEDHLTPEAVSVNPEDLPLRPVLHTNNTSPVSNIAHNPLYSGYANGNGPAHQFISQNEEIYAPSINLAGSFDAPHSLYPTKEDLQAHLGGSPQDTFRLGVARSWVDNDNKNLRLNIQSQDCGELGHSEHLRARKAYAAVTSEPGRNRPASNTGSYVCSRSEPRPGVKASAAFEQDHDTIRDSDLSQSAKRLGTSPPLDNPPRRQRTARRRKKSVGHGSGHSSRNSQRAEVPPVSAPGLDQDSAKDNRIGFACPFAKQSRHRYHPCYRHRPHKDVSRVKYHLLRWHTPKHYCDNCWERFKDKSLCDAHREAGCVRKPPTDIVTTEQHEQLTVRMESDEPESWYLVFSILFPNEQPPPSPYIDGALPAEIRALADCWQLEALVFWKTLLRELPITVSPQNRELETFFNKNNPIVVDAVFQAWKAKPPAFSQPMDLQQGGLSYAKQNDGVGPYVMFRVPGISTSPNMTVEVPTLTLWTSDSGIGNSDYPGNHDGTYLTAPGYGLQQQHNPYRETSQSLATCGSFGETYTSAAQLACPGPAINIRTIETGAASVIQPNDEWQDGSQVRSIMQPPITYQRDASWFH